MLFFALCAAAVERLALPLSHRIPPLLVARSFVMASMDTVPDVTKSAEAGPSVRPAPLLSLAPSALELS